MKKILLMAALLLVASGCATRVPYSATPMKDIPQALTALERTINTNPLKKHVVLNMADDTHLQLIGLFKGGGDGEKDICMTV